MAYDDRDEEMDEVFEEEEDTARDLTSGMVITTCGGIPSCFCSSRPTSRLKRWSVPPSSTSASRAIES